ncbi:hypothetical protein RAT170B_0691 [Rickettsia argasii T170-B]|uniref:Uncharacterized protein n=2 Tax=Rickettsia argasii TaxID=1441385 RepID=A0A0F3REW4_9RICK|nr:hypothetical protein RAT170B_0691 [Rickettsia argasii T170-B]
MPTELLILLRGVAMVLIHKIEPLSFWGPFFAFITANCGAILRDFIMKENSIGYQEELVLKSLYLWVIAFSVLLDMYSSNPNYHTNIQ